MKQRAQNVVSPKSKQYVVLGGDAAKVDGGILNATVFYLVYSLFTQTDFYISVVIEN